MPDDLIRHCFVDSNIWLYAFLESDDAVKSASARGLIRTTEPVISIQVVNEVCVNLLRKTDFAEADLQKLIKSFYQNYAVVEMTRATLLTASELRRHYSLSFWDSHIIASALMGGVSVVYSEDMQHGLVVEGHLQIVNPFLP